jgi:hypothetical protein
MAVPGASVPFRLTRLSNPTSPVRLVRRRLIRVRLISPRKLLVIARATTTTNKKTGAITPVLIVVDVAD